MILPKTFQAALPPDVRRRLCLAVMRAAVFVETQIVTYNPRS